MGTCEEMQVSSQDIVAYSGFTPMDTDVKEGDPKDIHERMHIHGPIKTLRAAGMLHETGGKLTYLNKRMTHRSPHTGEPRHIYLVRERFDLTIEVKARQTRVVLPRKSMNMNALISAIRCDSMTDLTFSSYAGPHTSNIVLGVNGQIDDHDDVETINDLCSSMWARYPDFGFEEHQLLMTAMVDELAITVEPLFTPRTIQVQVDGLRFLRFDGFFSTGWLYLSTVDPP